MRKFTIGGLSAVMIMVLVFGSVPLMSQPAAQANAGTQWQAHYFNNNTLTGSPTVQRVDDKIDFNWAGGSPDAAIPADNFSARWTKTVNFPTSGSWTFHVGADDGVRMWIDVTQIVDEWHGNPEGYRVYEVTLEGLTAGNHDLKVEYYEATGNAGVQVGWWVTGSGPAAPAPETPPVPVPEAPPVPPVTVIAAVTGYYVNVRTGPGLGNSVITQVFYPDNYLVLGAVPDLSWILIELEDGTSGWISNDWVWLSAKEDAKNEDTTGGGQPDFVDAIPRIDIEISPPAAVPQEPVAPVILQGRATDTLNLRDGPSAYAAKIIGAVPQGAEFEVEAHNGNGAWYLITYQGVRGWVSGLYVTLLDGYVRDLVASQEVVPEPPPGSLFVFTEEQGEPVTVRGRANAILKLRDAASLRGAQVDSVPQFTEFVIEGRNTNGAWYLVTYAGVQGWVSAPYVTLIEGGVTNLPIR